MIEQGDVVRVGRSRFYFDEIDVFLFRHSDAGRRMQPVSIEWAVVERGAAVSADMVLGAERAQQLMDDLWDAGLRPTQGRQSEGVTQAQGRHLEDMRTIAFRSINVEKPE